LKKKNCRGGEEKDNGMQAAVPFTKDKPWEKRNCWALKLILLWKDLIFLSKREKEEGIQKPTLGGKN